jgi:(E)-2-((N-methylformamido)methylene)succinate hydrolase
MSELAMRAATADDGVALSYEATGDGPPDVLFLHGWAGSGRSFDETIAALDTTRLRAITFDLRGHGGSDDHDDLTLDRIARDGLAVADAAGAGRVVLVGFSMGARFALYLAALEPERVAGLVLVAGCPTGEIPLPAELLADWYGRQGDAERLADVMRSFSKNPVDAAVFDRFGREAARIPLAALKATLESASDASFSADLGSITAPALVIGGSDDGMFTPDLLRATVVEPLPRARFVLLDANHEIPAEAPQELAIAIEAFLAGLGS